MAVLVLFSLNGTWSSGEPLKACNHPTDEPRNPRVETTHVAGTGIAVVACMKQFLSCRQFP
jgi:hypothetical protein